MPSGYFIDFADQNAAAKRRQIKESLISASKRYNGQGRDRTADTRIFSPVLYQLSYLSAGLFF